MYWIRYSILRDEFYRKLKISLRLSNNYLRYKLSALTYDLPCMKTKMKPRLPFTDYIKEKVKKVNAMTISRCYFAYDRRYLPRCKCTNNLFMCLINLAISTENKIDGDVFVVVIAVDLNVLTDVL